MRTGSVAGSVTGFKSEPDRKTRTEAKDGIKRDTGSVELEGAILVEHHRRHRGDRLGHRVDAPYGVGLDRGAGLLVAVAIGAEVDDLAAAGDEHEPARQAAIVDVARACT